jgi:2-polyprenyl-6-methoxyphenol hydroxylase-like FAD-dependent oxidoreductase
VLVDQKDGTAVSPQANATQARTMEHFRRLGFSREIRALGMPADYPTDIAYFTRFMGYELARFHLPSAREAEQKIKALSGSWSAAELPHRVSQKFVETVLRRHAEAWPTVSINYNWQLTGIRELDDHVEADIRNTKDGVTQTVRGHYLVGADGPRSTVRAYLGISYQGETGVVRHFMGGRMHAIYLRAPAFYAQSQHKPAWMHVTFNRERRAFMTAIDGISEFAFHTQLNPDEEEREISGAEARRMFIAAVGAPVKFDILSRGTWTAGHTLVAERFRQGRILIGGDAAHLFTPTGGLGYNTAVEDAINLAWKLAAVIRREAGSELLETYESERHAIALRNTHYARQFADSLGRLTPADDIEEQSERGDAARRAAGKYFLNHARSEFNIPGITFGGRYDGSRAIVADGTNPPSEEPNAYRPTACPGGRPPHLWLGEDRSLFDTFGMEWTLLRLGRHASDGQAFTSAANALGLSLKIVDVAAEEARDLYEADLALIRPDQVVGWRGSSDSDAERILRTICARD